MIEATGLAKLFGDFAAVSDVTLSVNRGEIVVLLGPNGAGKTTTVRMLAAILRVTRGQALVAGCDVETQPVRVRQRVGLLTEFPGLYDRMSAWDYLDFFGALQGLAQKLRRARMEQWMRRFEVWDARHMRLGEHSKGMRQKVALARALLHAPPVLLLDEPTSAMDPQSAHMVRECILELKEAGHTLLICTHNLAEAELVADRIGIIRLGRIIAHDTPANLRRMLLGPPMMEVRLNGSLDGVALELENVVSITERGPAWFRYEADEPENLNPRVIRRLTDLGVEVVTVSEVPRSLEEVYLRIVGTREQAVGDAGALPGQMGGGR